RNRLPLGLVVKAHVATDYGRAERKRRFAQPLDAPDELPHHLGPLGISIVEAVRDSDRTRTRARNIARRLAYGRDRAEIRIDRTRTRIRIDLERHRAPR